MTRSLVRPTSPPVSERIPAAVLREYGKPPEFAVADAPDDQAAVLILQGTDDVISDPEGGQLLHDRLGSTYKTLKLYDGLWHQLFNEPARDTVLADLTHWLNAHP
jgi:lysophospholipase